MANSPRPTITHFKLSLNPIIVNKTAHMNIHCESNVTIIYMLQGARANLYNISFKSSAFINYFTSGNSVMRFLVGQFKVKCKVKRDIVTVSFSTKIAN